jgi:hypothetical protein
MTMRSSSGSGCETPAGLGDRRSPGGMPGSVVDVLEREDGRRIVLRLVGAETTWLWAWGVFDAGDTATD